MRAVGWTSQQSVTLPLSFNAADGRDLGVRLLDVDGDNCADLVENGTAVFLGDCAANFARSTSWTNSLRQAGITFVDSQGRDRGVRLVDINGDARPDLVIAQPDRGEVHLNTGAGWVLDGAFSASLGSLRETGTIDRGSVDPECGPPRGPDGGVLADAGTTCSNESEYSFAFTFQGSPGESGGGVLADVNGDGLPDIVWNAQRSPGSFGSGAPNATSIDIVAVYRNTGFGFVRDAARSEALLTLPTGPFVIDSQPRGFDVIDVNGDGLADVLRTLAGAARVVYLGTGSAWVLDDGYTQSFQDTDIFSTDGMRSLGLIPQDYNGDGLLDYVRLFPGLLRAYRNTGTGWMADSATAANLVELGLTAVDSAGTPTGLTLGDMDGDGLIDLVQARQGNSHVLAGAHGPAGDLLVHATSALGEQTDIEYVPSTAFDHTDGAGREGMPFVLPVVRALTRHDGRGNSFRTEVTYTGGLFAEGGFKGFGESMTLDSRGVRERVQYLRSGPQAGQAWRTEILDSTGMVRSRRTVVHDKFDPSPGVSQVRVRQIDEETIDPGGSIHTRIRNTYDEFLNLTVVAKDGEVSIHGDETRTEFEYASNLSAGIVAFPSRVRVFGAQGELLSEATTRYDGLPVGSISAGNATPFL